MSRPAARFAARPAVRRDLDRGTGLLAVSCYDRDGRLTAEELEALDFVSLHQNGRGLEGAYAALERLALPVRDAAYSLHLLDTSPASVHDGFCGARRTLLLEVHRLGRTYWAWSEEEWARTARAAHATHRMYVALSAYLLGGIPGARLLAEVGRPAANARRVFGREAVESALEQVKGVLEGWGYACRTVTLEKLDAALCAAMLAARSPDPEHLDRAALEALLPAELPKNARRGLVLLSQALADLGTIEGPLPGILRDYGSDPESTGADPEWRAWCDRWLEHSVLATKARIHRDLLRVGGWLAQNHPGVRSPKQWDAPLAASYVAAVDGLKAGDLGRGDCLTEGKPGEPYAARTKSHHLYVVRRFLQDCHDWGWATMRFDAGRCLRVPRAIRNLIGPDPKTVDDAVWARLVSAGLDLGPEDVPQRGKAGPFYPAEMVRAAAVIWLFAGLRSDEIRRLRVGCVRWQSLDAPPDGNDGEGPAREEMACFLEVPVNKTSAAFSKPVHPVVGRRIEEWERARPKDQPAALDEKTGEAVHFLLSYRGRRFGRAFFNESLIPTLCRKAGVPEEDSRGKITSHRARATITSQLFNGPDPWTLPELGAWLGHKNLSSTQHYAKIDLTKLAEKVASSGYLERNAALVEVLLDVEGLANGETENVLYYDLGHGLCANPYWAKCPYRMACVRCPMYVPGEEARYVRAKEGVRRMLETVPLTEEERRAAEGDAEALNALANRDAKVPVPADRDPSRTAIVPLRKKGDADRRD